MRWLNPLRNLWLFLLVIGPGIITSNVDNDAGGIATYALAGAQFGYSLIWTLIPITLLLIVMQEYGVRMSIATGKGLSDLIREEFGVVITVLVMVGLFIANLATTVADVAGMAAAGEIFGIPRIVLVPVVLVFLWLVLVKSKYVTFERIVLGLIVFFGAYVLSGLLARPDWLLVAKESVMPSISFTKDYWILLVAIIGTSICPWMQFYLQSSIVEKGVKIEHLRISRFDVIIGSILTSVVAFFIIVATGSTLFPAHNTVNDAAQVALSLAPLAGQFASWLFAIGLFFAGFLGAWIIPLSSAYNITEGLGFESGINKKLHEAPVFYGLMGVILLVSGAVVLIPGIPLFPLIIVANIVNAMLLPFVFLLLLVLINKKRVMKDHTNTRIGNVVGIASLLALLAVDGLLLYTTLAH